MSCSDKHSCFDGISMLSDLCRTVQVNYIYSQNLQPLFLLCDTNYITSINVRSALVLTWRCNIYFSYYCIQPEDGF